MIRKGIIIDLSRFKIERVCTYDTTRVEDLYVKVDGKDLIPAAYVYPIENKKEVEAALKELAEAKIIYDNVQGRIFYQVLSKLR